MKLDKTDFRPVPHRGKVVFFIQFSVLFILSDRMYRSYDKKKATLNYL